METDQENQDRIYLYTFTKHVVGVEPMPGTGGKAKEPRPCPWEASGLEGARPRSGLCEEGRGGLWGPGVWRPSSRKARPSLLCAMAVGGVPEHHTHLTFPAFHTCWDNASM